MQAHRWRGLVKRGYTGVYRRDTRCTRINERSVELRKSFELPVSRSRFGSGRQVGRLPAQSAPDLSPANESCSFALVLAFVQPNVTVFPSAARFLPRDGPSSFPPTPGYFRIFAVAPPTFVVHIYLAVLLRQGRA